MEFLQILLGTFTAYLIGSIPTTVLISKFFFGIDIREHGSGAASHINTQRVLGWKASLVARVIDIAKGLLATNLAIIFHLKYGFYSDIEYPMLMMTFGLAAVTGHIFPIFARFRGGKGVHPGIGVLLALDPIITLVCIGVGIAIFFLTRYPNLGYVIGSFTLPLLVWATHNQSGEDQVPMLIFGVILFAMLFFTHLKNLRDILRGKELKAAVIWLTSE